MDALKLKNLINLLFKQIIKTMFVILLNFLLSVVPSHCKPSYSSVVYIQLPYDIIIFKLL